MLDRIPLYTDQVFEGLKRVRDVYATSTGSYLNGRSREERDRMFHDDKVDAALYASTLASNYIEWSLSDEFQGTVDLPDVIQQYVATSIGQLLNVIFKANVEQAKASGVAALTAYDKVVYYVYMMELIDQPESNLLSRVGLQFRGGMSPRPAEVTEFVFKFVWEFFNNPRAIDNFNSISPVARVNERYALTQKRRQCDHKRPGADSTDRFRHFAVTLDSETKKHSLQVKPT